MRKNDLKLFTVIIPARNEESVIESTVRSVNSKLNERGVPHEVLVVDDGSSDRTWEIITRLKEEIPQVNPVRNNGSHGYGRAILYGFSQMNGDAVTVTMADASEDPEDICKFWEVLNEGYDCAFGSRWNNQAKVVGYEWKTRILNRLVNRFVQLIFWTSYNDMSNGFKGFRREVIEHSGPFISPHFSLAIEVPLRAYIRGYTWKAVPNNWTNRKAGEGKLKLWEMGSWYSFVILYCLLERLLTQGEFKKENQIGGTGNEA